DRVAPVDGVAGDLGADVRLVAVAHQVGEHQVPAALVQQPNKRPLVRLDRDLDGQVFEVGFEALDVPVGLLVPAERGHEAPPLSAGSANRYSLRATRASSTSVPLAFLCW